MSCPGHSSYSLGDRGFLTIPHCFKPGRFERGKPCEGEVGFAEREPVAEFIRLSAYTVEGERKKDNNFSGVRSEWQVLWPLFRVLNLVAQVIVVAEAFQQKLKEMRRYNLMFDESIRSEYNEYQ
jgi:hypothetical protein